MYKTEIFEQVYSIFIQGLKAVNIKINIKLKSYIILSPNKNLADILLVYNSVNSVLSEELLLWEVFK
jgi:ribosomal protein L20